MLKLVFGSGTLNKSSTTLDDHFRTLSVVRINECDSSSGRCRSYRLRLIGTFKSGLYDIDADDSISDIFAEMGKRPYAHKVNNGPNINIQADFFVSFLTSVLSSPEQVSMDEISPTLLALNSVLQLGWRPTDTSSFDTILSSILQPSFLNDQNGNHSAIIAVKAMVTTTVVLDKRLTAKIVEILMSLLQNGCTGVAIDIIAGILLKFDDSKREISASLRPLSLLNDVKLASSTIDPSPESLISPSLSLQIPSSKSTTPSEIKSDGKWKEELALGSIIDFFLPGIGSDDSSSWLQAEVVRVNKKDGTLKLEYVDRDGTTQLKVVAMGSSEFQKPSSSAVLDSQDSVAGVEVEVGGTVRYRLNCPLVQLRIRPTPSLEQPEVGFLHHMDEIEVYDQEVRGFHRLKDGRVRSM